MLLLFSPWRRSLGQNSNNLPILVMIADAFPQWLCASGHFHSPVLNIVCMMKINVITNTPLCQSYTNRDPQNYQKKTVASMGSLISMGQKTGFADAAARSCETSVHDGTKLGDKEKRRKHSGEKLRDL
jgi:hypothetical protein